MTAVLAHGSHSKPKEDHGSHDHATHEHGSHDYAEKNEQKPD